MLAKTRFVTAVTACNRKFDPLAVTPKRVFCLVNGWGFLICNLCNLYLLVIYILILMIGDTDVRTRERVGGRVWARKEIGKIAVTAVTPNF